MQPFTACGGNYSNDDEVLTSPFYPNQYPELSDCVYVISQPNGTYITISFLSVDINCDGLTLPTSDYIEMRDGNSEGSPLLARICGNGSDVPNFMQTTQNHLRVR